MSNQNKIKYDSAYISYVANGDSAAVFIARDIVRSIDTSGMWIDVISTSGYKNEYLYIPNMRASKIRNILHGKQQMRI